MFSKEEIIELEKSSRKIRRNIVKMVYNAKSGHPGGSLSGVDILNVLFEKCLNIPADWDASPEFENRDRFVLSKGHASPLLYSILANHGLLSEDELLTFRKLGTNLQGHPSKLLLKGIETSTGSLGQGISIACGIAMGLKLDKNPATVVVYTGDGELQEGSCWEAFMQAAHRNLDNLVVIIDRNRLQIDGNTENVMRLESLHDKLKAFGLDVFEINGHDYNQIFSVFEQAKKSTRPSVIIANTVKGKGVSYMENDAGWHGKAPNDDEYKTAMKELGE